MTKAKILIVQNDETGATRLEERLRGLGYTACATASSGRQAVEEAAGRCPDVALIDLGLEGERSGIEVAEQLGGQFDVPVIYLTNDTEESLLQQAETTQPYAYVLKPVDPRQLHLSIRTTLSLHEKEMGYRARESGLRRTTRIMDTILNSTRDGVVAADGAGRILFTNSQAKQIVGTVEDMQPGDLYDASERQKKYGLFEPDKKTYVPTDQLPLVHALQGQETEDKEVFIRNEQKPQGAYVSVIGRTLWSDDRAAVEGGVVFFRDTTREKEAEADLQHTVSEFRDQAQLMETVFESMDEAIFIATADGSPIWANARMEQMIGLGIVREKSDEWPRVYGCYYPDQETMVPADELPTMRVLRGESLDDVELFFRNEHKPEGVYVSVTGRPLLDDNLEIQAGVVVLRDVTENRLAQARLEETVVELRTQTRLMQTVFDNMEEGVVVADTAGNFLLTNQRREEIIGMKLVASEPADWPATFGAFHLDKQTQVPTDELPMVRAMRGESTEDVELFIRNERRPEGAYVRVRGRPLLDSNDEVVAGVAIFSDITKYKQTEDELEQTISDLKSQAQLVETVLESISDGVLAADADGRFTIFNSSALETVGLGITEAPPDQWAPRYGIFKADKKTFFPTDELPLVRAMQGKATDDLEMFIRNEKRPEGVYLSVNGRPLQKNTDGHGGGVITFRNVTGRKTAETVLKQAVDELRDQSELMQATFNGISDGLVIISVDGVLLNVNPAAKQIIGIEMTDSPPAELERKWGASYYPDRQTPIKTENLPLYRAITHGESTSEMDIFIQNHKRPDGFFVRVSTQPLRRPGGSIRGGVIIFRDVTDQVIAQEALTRAFTQGRLEIIDTILHNIGNAINSVTTGIGTVHRTLNDNRLLHRFHAFADAVKAHQEDWVDYLEHDPQGQKVMPFITMLADGFAKQNVEMARTVARVRERANHIADIIRNQKALDSPHMSRKDIGLKQALSAAIKVLHDSLNRRSIKVEVHCHHTPREIRIQESQFHQMMVNLIKNSMEAIDELAAAGGLKGAPHILIRAYVEGDFLHLDVVDNGIGIDNKKFRVIFAAGYTTKKSGSGLGLHSAVNFVIGMGGRMDALSDGIGKGATMRIMLRLSSIVPIRNTYSAESG